ncbi:endonuclease VIII [Escherichia coli]|uniref:endonuclease VIII n=1 Tax=Escherichia coli TaxID=562 RepID=UPI000BE1A3BB|nr:endonuclease VIII [Escherichia coli]MBC0328715.1 endonuclease VIII [Escherichia coli]
MPEGPEIRRAADNLEAAIKGKPLTDVWFAFPQLKTYQSQLIGQHVTHVETRGKALLTHFSNDLTLYSHNQLYGVWRVVDTGEEPQTTRVLRVKLQTADKTILLYSASDIEMLRPEQLTTHPFLQRVGPDVLDPNLTPEVVKERLLSPRFRNRQFAGLLLDQAFLEIPRFSYATRGQVDENKHHGALFRFKVFHRDGELCERCGGIIEKTTLSSRPFYWCPGCQH